MKDRIGISWRAELAAGILSNLDCIDVVEVMADDLFDAPKSELRAIQTLAAQVPVVLHGVSLGLASAERVQTSQLDRMARVVDAIEPEFWSEHLAFVRSNGVEVGHLAAPPRSDASIDGAAKNILQAARVVGSKPLMENIASLIAPPGSTHDEVTWISGIAAASDCELLLDLNNLHVNATNFQYSAQTFLASAPLDRVRSIHLAGGKWLTAANGERRLLDDHLHDVPDAVYELLTEVGASAPRSLSVILERDGAYPAFANLRTELERAREALEIGRLRRVERSYVAARHSPSSASAYRAAQGFQAYLARLYRDPEARARFLENPRQEAAQNGLEQAAREALEQIDRVGLELAAQSFAKKRAESFKHSTQT